MYEITDRHLAMLTKSIKYRFLRARATFDELNILESIKKSKELYSSLDKLNREHFKKIAEEVKKEVEKEYDLSGEGVEALLVVEKALKQYDPKVEYVYNREVERKRARFLESVVATEGQMKSFSRATNAWIFQTKQFADSVTEKTELEVFKANGFKKVRWETQKDNRVCAECRAREGKIYPIDAIPDTHPNCRRILIPIKEED